jgi:hypothetical protein
MVRWFVQGSRWNGCGTEKLGRPAFVVHLLFARKYSGLDTDEVQNYPRSSTVTLGGNAADLTEIDGAALQNNTQPTNGLPAVDESDFPQHPVFV